MKYKCGLCTHVYDEAKEGVEWADLPDNWVCPICGSPKSTFTVISEDEQKESSAPEEVPSSFICGLCSYVYDEEKEGVPWDELSEDWRCPICGSGKEAFTERKSSPSARAAKKKRQVVVEEEYLAEWRRPSDEFEDNMADIHAMAISGKTIIEPMRTRMPSFSWEEVLFKGTQLTKLPLNKSQPVSLRTTIGPDAKVPLVLDGPVFVSHMSFGALSKEAKMSLSRGSAVVNTAMCSGEGGILPESMEAAHKYIFEYVPNKYSVSDEFLSRVDAVEIKIGQSAKPGMGGHLPGHKVTKEIARVRGFREGQDIISPSHFSDIRNGDELKAAVDMLRTATGGKPIGVKFAAGHIEEDLDIALAAGVDFITIDGRAGGTGAAPKVVKNVASIPTIFALARARKHLDTRKSHVSLVITGGLRVSSDFAKALAMGADAVAIGTAAMMALGCQQYRICDTGKCPVGIATQDPALRARLNVDKSSVRVANFFKAVNHELEDFSRLTGNDDVHNLSVSDLCTTNSEISGHTVIEHV